MKPLISIIVPCYNAAEFLPECMESLEKQTIGLENIELISVDDSSTDNGKTWNEILKFEKKHSEQVIAIHLEENLCPGGARNVGIKYANADIIGFCDSDDWVDITMYEKLYQAMQKYDSDVAECCMSTVEEPLTGEIHYYDYGESAIEGGELHTDIAIHTITKIYKKDLIVNYDLWFPEHIKFEDQYWIHMLRLYIKSFCYVDEVLYNYRINPNSITHVRNSNHYFDRIKIELMKLDRYRELGVYDRFYRRIEIDFLFYYYTCTLYDLWRSFDHPDYRVYQEIVQTVKCLFPDYANNPYLNEPGRKVTEYFIKFIDLDLSEEEFIEVGKVIAAI